jgi:hypothetical protein
LIPIVVPAGGVRPVDGEVSHAVTVEVASHSRQIRRSSGQALQYGHELGTASRLINSAQPRFAAHEMVLTRHLGTSRSDDHQVRMTSLIILVI